MDDTTTLTLQASHGFDGGDKILLDGDTNRVRRRIVSVDSSTTLSIFTHVRASKGYRRHVRRAKALKRRGEF